jgi:hypothetical protein
MVRRGREPDRGRALWAARRPRGSTRRSWGAAFPRTHHVLQLEFGDRKDFDDPRKEWRRLFSELLGTFALVLAAAGGGFCTRRDRSASQRRSLLRA